MAAKIIISGHSSGLGKALAELYLEQGCPVLGIARRMLPPREGLQQCTLDLSDSGTLARWLESGAPEAFINGADELVLINNAGTVAPSAVCGKQRPSEIAAAVALNVAAPLMLTNHVLAVRPESLPVKIVHISSGAGRKAYPGWSVYGATKAALDHHARCVAAEDRRNVAIASIAPGVVDTAMQAEIRGLPQDEFPVLPRFVQLRRENGLASPESAAALIAAMIADEDFGGEVIEDVRRWQELKETFQTASALRERPSET